MTAFGWARPAPARPRGELPALASWRLYRRGGRCIAPLLGDWVVPLLGHPCWDMPEPVHACPTSRARTADRGGRSVGGGRWVTSPDPRQYIGDMLNAVPVYGRQAGHRERRAKEGARREGRRRRCWFVVAGGLGGVGFAVVP